MSWKNQLLYIRGLLILEMRQDVVQIKRCHELTQAISIIKDIIIEQYEKRYENDNHKQTN